MKEKLKKKARSKKKRFQDVATKPTKHKQINRKPTTFLKQNTSV